MLVWFLSSRKASLGEVGNAGSCSGLFFQHPSFWRQWLSLSNVLQREGKCRRELMNRKWWKRETDLMSSGAALVWLPIDTIRPLKKDIVCTCFLAFNSTTLWPICRNFHCTQLIPFPSGGFKYPWSSHNSLLQNNRLTPLDGTLCILTAYLCTEGDPYAVAAIRL